VPCASLKSGDEKEQQQEMDTPTSQIFCAASVLMNKNKTQLSDINENMFYRVKW